MSKLKNTEFEAFTDGLYDLIFEETSKYLSNCIGSEDWRDDLHNTHGVVMWNAIVKIATDMGLKQHFKDE